MVLEVDAAKLEENEMKYKIESHENKINIYLHSKADERNALLSNFELCQKGQCGCPTDEYKKLQTLKINFINDELVLNLESKPNQNFNINEIKKCLDYTFNKIKRD